MTTLLQLPDRNIQILAQVLVHFIWQGTAVALLLAAVVSSTRLRRPTVRYQCSLLALAVMAAAPLVTCCWIAASEEALPAIEAQMPPQASRSAILPEVPESDLSATAPDEIRTAPAEFIADHSRDSTVSDAALPSVKPDDATVPHRATQESPLIDQMGLWDRTTPWIVAGWFMGVAALSIRLLLGWMGVTRLRRSAVTPPDWVTATISRLASALHIATPLIRVSHQVGEAIALGFVKPMILLPVAWVTELPADMLEAIIAHELAHIRRRDLWVNLMQRVLETLLFYHPAVWWLSRRIRIERELCCDEMVVSVTQNRLRYAETLEHIGRMSLTPARSVLMVSITGSRTVLLDRIRHILNPQPRDRSLNVWLAGALPLVIAGLIWTASAGVQDTVAHAEDQAVPAEKETGEKAPAAAAPSVVTLPQLEGYPDLKLVERELGGIPFQHDHSVTSLGWLDAGKSVLTSTRAGIQVWDVATRQIKWQMATAPQNDCLATVDRAGTRIAMTIGAHAELIEWPSTQRVREFKESGITVGKSGRQRGGTPQAISLSPDGKWLALAYINTGNHGYLRIYDADTGNMATHRDGPPTPALCWSPDSKILAAGEKRGIVIFLTPNGVLQRPGITLPKTEQPLGLTFNRDGSRLAVLTVGGSTSLWGMSDRKLIWNKDTPANSRMDFRQGYGGIAFNRDETKLITRSFRGRDILNADTGEVESAQAGPPLGLANLVLSPRGDLMAVGGPRNGFDLLDGRTLQSTLPSADMSRPAVDAIKLSPNCQYLLVRGGSYLEVIDAGRLERLVELPISPAVTDACWSPDGQSIALLRLGSRTEKASAEIIKFTQATDTDTVAKLSVSRKIELEERIARGCAFSPDGQRLAVTENQKLSLWNVSTGEQIWKKNLCEKNDWLSQVAFSPDGVALAVPVYQPSSAADVRCIRAGDGELLGQLATGGRPSRLQFIDSATLVTVIERHSEGPFRVEGDRPVLTEWNFVERTLKEDRTITSSEDAPFRSVLSLDMDSNRMALALPITSILASTISLRDIRTQEEQHRFQLPGEIFDVEILPGNRIAFLKRNGNILVLRIPEAPEAKAVALTPPKADSKPDSKVPAGESLSELIAAVRKQEALFRNYSATIKTVREYAPLSAEEEKERSRRNTFDFGPMVLRSVTKINQQSVQDQRYKFDGEEVHLLTSGGKLTDRWQSVSNGSKTVDIEVGKSATVHAGRAETLRMFPPHTWGMYLLRVNFPLSVYLSGTEAVKLEPKAGWRPVERGSSYEFYKVEAERVGEEIVEGLDCTKVRVNRSYDSNDGASFQYLWLAKDRNLHVARAVSGYMKKGQETISQALHVTKWQEVSPGVWLPVTVEVEPLPKEETSSVFKVTYQFVVEKATLNPVLAPDFFELPVIPKSIPTFHLDLNAQLTDSPDHPIATEAAQGTTLESILDRLAVEEQKYERYEVLTHETHTHTNLGDDLTGGMQLSRDAQQRTVVSGRRECYEEKSTRKGADGSTTSSTERQADDGKMIRTVYEYSAVAKPSIWGSLHLGVSNTRSAVRPHTLVLGHDRKLQSLAAHLRSGWSDIVNKYPLTVEYVGDELVGGLHCHKLKCTTVGSLYYFLWLARDRNLLVIRRMWYEPRWNKSLPTSLGRVDDLRELRPGVWFPYHSTYYAFQKISQEGLGQNRLTLQWRTEMTVDQLISEPAIDETLFQGADLPEGSNVVVSVADGQDQFRGQFKQPQTGKISISDEALLKMRQEARVNKEEAERRQQALDALIGKPAPELPGGTWLNSEPLTWKSLAGKVVIVDFWATWCGPCEPDLYRLADIQQAYQNNDIKDRVILGIHTAGTERDKIAKVASEKKLTYPIIIDSIAKSGERSWGDLFEKFAVKQLPLTMVVDRDGKVVAHGPLEKMLGEAAKLTEKKE